MCVCDSAKITNLVENCAQEPCYYAAYHHFHYCPLSIFSLFSLIIIRILALTSFHSASNLPLLISIHSATARTQCWSFFCLKIALGIKAKSFVWPLRPSVTWSQQDLPDLSPSAPTSLLPYILCKHISETLILLFPVLLTPFPTLSTSVSLILSYLQN